jgi:hypothetical protein
MKKILLACAASLLLASSAFATITVSDTPNRSNAGGEFGITGELGAFNTFCVEVNEYITLPGTYNVTLSSGAINGGTGGQTSPNFDPLSKGTSWLYSQFLAGTLPGYFTGNRAANAGDLQNAIWWLEGESLGVHNGYAILAEGHGGTADAAPGENGVWVMNLTDDNGGLHQSLLAPVVPEPTTMIAGALLLLPFGSSAIRILRKKHTA